LQKATGVELELKSSANGAQPVVVGFDGSQLKVMDAKAPGTLANGGRTLNLRVFLDRSVLEVVADDSVWVTKTIPPLDANATLHFRSLGGVANLKLLQVWPIKTIW
jgi:sucrose-6-phosphate hydrolase SacC (GH32 family)